MIDISKIDSLSARKRAIKLKSKKQKSPREVKTMLIAKKKLLEMIELTGKDCRTIPVLEAVLLEQKDGNLNFRWSNLGQMIEINEPVKGEGNCILAVPQKILKESVKMLKEDEISIDINCDEGLRAKVSDGKIESTIKNCFPAEEFPELPKRIDAKGEEIEASVFLEGLKKVLFAMSADEMRLNLCGVYIELSEDSLEFTATTGVQLANWKVEGKFNKSQFILPTEAVKMLLKLLKKEGIVKIRKNKEYVQFELDNVLETFHLEDLKFPDWRASVYIDDSYEKIILDKKEFAEILKTSKIESASKFIFNNQKLVIETENMDRKIRQKISYNGNVNITILLDCKVLIEGIKQIESPDLRIWLKKKNDAIAIKGDNYQYFLMPRKSEE